MDRPTSPLRLSPFVCPTQHPALSADVLVWLSKMSASILRLTEGSLSSGRPHSYCHGRTFRAVLSHTPDPMGYVGGGISVNIERFFLRELSIHVGRFV